MALEALASGIIALAFAAVLSFFVMKESPGTQNMQEISRAIQQGSQAYLRRQYKVISIFAIMLAIIIYVFLGYLTALGFLIGAFLSALAGFIGMNISVRSNSRTANAAKKGLNRAFDVAFRGGAVTGFAVVGLGLLGVVVFYLLFGDIKALIGFGFGASLISLFARVGGGVYTKAADVGADLVGKIEKGIPEDDPRNPAVIADNVGDNVGDCAGMAADLFETYTVTLIATMLLGSVIFINSNNGVLYTILIGSAGIIASIIGSFFVRIGKSKNIMNALYKGLLASAILAAAAFYYLNLAFLQNMGIYYASLAGLFVTVCLFFITDYFTSKNYRPVQMIAKASETGAATNIIAGLSVGMMSTIPPLIVIIIGIFVAYAWAGVYGIAIAAMSMLSLTGIVVAIDAYGPITDNAGGIAEMTNAPKNVRNITDSLDAVGNTTKAVTKGFAIGSAALAALALFAAYAQEVESLTNLNSFALNILDPYVLIGLFIGASIPFLFSSLLMQAVGRAAFDVVKEVRRQFKTIRGIMQHKAKPDYAKAVEIVTAAAQRELLIPGLIAVLSPLLIGLIFGVYSLGGFLVGAIVSGFLLATMLTTSGAAWDNAKKYIEAGNLGGKGSDAHKAAVVGDTVGDPSKDTAGPSINPLIKVLNIVALLFLSLIIQYSVLGG